MDEKLITPETKKKLLATASLVLRESEKALIQSIEMRRRLNIDGSHEDYVFWNAYEFILLVQFDVSCLMRDMVSHESELGPNLYARLLVLTIHESTLTMRRLLSKDFQELLGSTLGSDVGAAVRQVHSSVQKLFEKCNQQMGAVRDGIVGHRDADADIRVELLERADVQKVTDLTIELLQTLGSLLPYLYLYITMKIAP